MKINMKKTVKDFIYTHQIIYIMVNGKIIKCQDMVYIFLQMDNIIKDKLIKVKKMDLELFIIKIKVNIKVIGKMIKK